MREGIRADANIGIELETEERTGRREEESQMRRCGCRADFEVQRLPVGLRASQQFCSRYICSRGGGKKENGRESGV